MSVVEERKRALDQPLTSSHKNNNGSSQSMSMMNRTASGSSYGSAANGSTYGGYILLGKAAYDLFMKFSIK